MIELKLRDAELAGVGLTGEKKARFNAIQEELAKLSRQFGQNVLDATKAFELLLTTHSDVAGLPRSALAQAAERARKSHPQGLPRNEAALRDLIVAAAATVENGPWLITLDGAQLRRVHDIRRAPRTPREALPRLSNTVRSHVS